MLFVLTNNNLRFLVMIVELSKDRHLCLLLLPSYLQFKMLVEEGDEEEEGEEVGLQVFIYIHAELNQPLYSYVSSRNDCTCNGSA